MHAVKSFKKAAKQESRTSGRNEGWKKEEKQKNNKGRKVVEKFELRFV